MGVLLLPGLQFGEQQNPHITDVRGCGLMIGVEFDAPIKEFRQRLVKEQHVFTGAASTNILRLLPPLSLTMEEAAEAIRRLKANA